MPKDAVATPWLMKRGPSRLIRGRRRGGGSRHARPGVVAAAAAAGVRFVRLMTFVERRCCVLKCLGVFFIVVLCC